jgi:predicted small metal-binding protein
LFEHSCRKAGHGACGYTIRAGSEGELRRALADHVRAKHEVPQLTDTIYNYLRAVASR